MAEYAGIIYGVVAIAASAAGSVVSYQQGQQAAKQSEYNAKAQADAIAAEQKRKNLELAENQRRLSLQSRRERATQLADLVGTGRTWRTVIILEPDNLRLKTQPYRQPTYSLRPLLQTRDALRESFSARKQHPLFLSHQ